MSFLGIDVGTSGTKALLLSPDGRVLATAESPHLLLTPRPGWTEQAPENWWTAAILATKAALKKSKTPARNIKAIGLSGQMHGSVFLNTARPSPPPRAPLERPANRRPMRTNRTNSRWPQRTDPQGLQPRPHRLHRPKNSLVPKTRTPNLRQMPANPPPQGLPPLPPHRRIRLRIFRRIRHPPPRRQKSPLASRVHRQTRSGSHAPPTLDRIPGNQRHTHSRRRTTPGPHPRHPRHRQARAIRPPVPSAAASSPPASSPPPWAPPASSSPPPTPPKPIPTAASTPCATPSPKPGASSDACSLRAGHSNTSATSSSTPKHAASKTPAISTPA